MRINSSANNLTISFSAHKSRAVKVIMVRLIAIINLFNDGGTYL